MKNIAHGLEYLVLSSMLQVSSKLRTPAKLQSCGDRERTGPPWITTNCHAPYVSTIRKASSRRRRIQKDSSTSFNPRTYETFELASLDRGHSVGEKTKEELCLFWRASRYKCSECCVRPTPMNGDIVFVVQGPVTSSDQCRCWIVKLWNFWSIFEELLADWDAQKTAMECVERV